MLDRTAITQLIADIGEDVFLRLSQQFLDETINRLAVMAASRDQEEWQDLARHAHSLKSTSQSFGLVGTGELARSLQMAADHLDIPAIDQALPQLIKTADGECQEFEQLRRELSLSLR